MPTRQERAEGKAKGIKNRKKKKKTKTGNVTITYH
jgi:hypothetical protein